MKKDIVKVYNWMTESYRHLENISKETIKSDLKLDDKCLGNILFDLMQEFGIDKFVYGDFDNLNYMLFENPLNKESDYLNKYPETLEIFRSAEKTKFTMYDYDRKLFLGLIYIWPENIRPRNFENKEDFENRYKLINAGFDFINKEGRKAQQNAEFWLDSCYSSEERIEVLKLGIKKLKKMLGKN